MYTSQQKIYDIVLFVQTNVNKSVFFKCYLSSITSGTGWSLPSLNTATFVTSGGVDTTGAM